jgi:hypothetical protein
MSAVVVVVYNKAEEAPSLQVRMTTKTQQPLAKKSFRGSRLEPGKYFENRNYASYRAESLLVINSER